MGHLTRDPEMKVTPSGLEISSMSVATSRKYKGQDGQMQEDTTFVDVTAFGNQAKAINQYLGKGKPIFIEGRLKLDQWQDKNTQQNRQKLSVVVEKFTFLPRNDGAQAGGAPQGGQQRSNIGYNAPPNAGAEYQGYEADPSDQIPF